MSTRRTFLAVKQASALAVLVLLVSVLLSTARVGGAAAQYIPPHSNDPHPPANQPSYQLPGPLSRPGVPGYPGAAHSNDPHYQKTQPQLSWPKSTIPPAPSQSIPRATTTPPYYRSTTPQARRKAAPKQREHKTISLEQCYRNWDRSTRMSRAAWQRSCRRNAIDGRVKLW